MSTIPDGDALLATAEDLVGAAGRAGADQAEVYLEAGASIDLDIEGGRLASGNTAHTRGGAIRVVKDGRLGFAYFVDPGQAEAAIQQAMELAKLAPQTGYSLPAANGFPAPLGGRWDDALAGLDTDHAVRLAKEMLQGAGETCPDGTVTGGGVSMGWGLAAIASNAGVAVWDRATHLSAGASLTLQDGGEGGGAISAWDSLSRHQANVDAHGLGAELGRTVHSLRDPAPATAGTADLVLLPDAAAELVLGLIGSAVDGDTAARGKSVWSDRLGESVAHPGLTLTDDGRFEGGVGTSPFDGEGLPTLARPVIEDGVLRTFLWDSWDAHRHGASATHNAQRSGFKSPPGAGANHWVLSHRERLPRDKLVAGIDHGYLVESVLGAHTANATTGDFSITAPNVWRIEKGAVAGASREAAIGGNLPELLGRLDAVGDQPVRRDGSTSPALRFRDVTFSV